MNDPVDDVIRTLTRCTGVFDALLALAVAVVVVIRLRGTPSGLLLTAGLCTLSLTALSARAFYFFVLEPAYDRPDLDLDAVMVQGASVTACTSIVEMLGWALLGVGAALIPASLRRLAAKKPAA